MELKFPDLIAQHMGTELEEILGMTMEEFFAAGNTYGYFLRATEGYSFEVGSSVRNQSGRKPLLGHHLLRHCTVS